ncbi:MAG: hypothetical protein JSR36_13370 [Proteobacteria bacterium]|nr:hypothetical protein [Pseudomonadota bacterium]
MSRDYKVRRAAPLQMRRLRDFGAGAAAGTVLTALVFVALHGAARRDAAAGPAPPPLPPPATAPAAGSVRSPSTDNTFYKDLVHPEAEQARRERELQRNAAAAAR